MSLLFSMERKKKIALILLSIVLVIFVLCPLWEHLSCDEPSQGFASFIVDKIIGRERQNVCPSAFGTLMSVFKNVFFALSGLVVGYAAGEPESERKKDTSRSIHSCISLNVGRWDASDEFLEIDVHESQIVKRDIF